MANSMGAEVAVHAFSSLHREADLANAQTEIEHVVLTAPDVDRAAFNDRFKQEISVLAKNLTVYVSSNDRALLMSRVINLEKRLGESAFDLRNPDQFETAAGFFELVEPDDVSVNMVDVTPINRTRNFHNFSLETPEFFDNLYLRLVNTDMPLNRSGYHAVTRDGKAYSVLTRGR